MDKIISLLKEKNHYLEKFFSANERELLNFIDGNFDNLESFYLTRDKILDLIRCLDGLIEEENGRGENFTGITALQRNEVESLLRSKDELVNEILAQDLQILSCIEKEKSGIIREIQSTRKSRKVMQAYKSGQAKKQLDEKA